jgi:thiol-disulfide isomerase/thioredoxin
MTRQLTFPIALAISLVAVAASGGAEPQPKAISPDPKVKMLGLNPDLYMDPKEAAKAAELLEKAFEGSRQPEVVRMLLTILKKGADIGGQDGWFGPAETRYTWSWLIKQQKLDPKTTSILREKFQGPQAFFKHLDRDVDGQITAGDLDWSDRSSYVQQAAIVNRLFRRMSTRGDGRVTREDMETFFKKASQGKDHLTIEDMRDTLLSGVSSSFLPGDAPDTSMLIRSLFAGELGSMNEGPHIDEAAPDFTLKSPDGKTTIQLSKLLGSRPVVLVLGNFTCGPFRSYVPQMDTVYQRHKDHANFVMVYVREAHPTDGWRMESNAKVGVAVKQPTTYAERVKVCDQFCEKLKPTMPVVVDEINDAIGNAYSGMPARLYVIDPQGKVAYKSGRGPFGFKIGEMEQALVMSLMGSDSLEKP